MGTDITDMKTSPARRTSGRLLFLLVLVAVIGYGWLLMDDAADRATIDEVQAMIPGMAEAQKPADGLMTLMKSWKSADSIAEGDAATINGFIKKAESLIPDWKKLKTVSGAAERARRITVAELHNAVSLGQIMLDCYSIRLSPLMRNVTGGCHSYAGPQVLEDISGGRKALGAILNAPATFRKYPPPTPSEAFKNYAGKRPNIIVVLIDTLRADKVGVGLMPYVDSLAGSGCYYRETRSQAPVTHLSTASMLTSQFPYTNGLIHDDSTWNYQLSLADEFRKAGYTTAAFSANYLIAPETGFNFGFDYFVQRHWANADTVNEAVISWFESSETRGKNFFLYIHTVDPHSPYLSPDQRKKILAEQQTAPFWSFTVSPNALRNTYIAKKRPVPPDVAREVLPRLVRNYDYEVRYADRQLATLRKYLDANGLLENTIIVVMADHGEAFLEHGDVEHTRNLYDELVHVPLVMWGGPFTSASCTDNGRPSPGLYKASLMDVMPTLLEAAGIRVPDSVQGRSLLRPAIPRPSFSMTTMGYDVPTGAINQTMHSMAIGDFKIIQNATKGSYELYSLASDPAEMHNLYSPGFQLSGEMTRWLARWVKSAKDAGATEKKAAPAPKLPARTPETNEMLKRLKSLGYTE